MARILVTDGGQRSALAAARSLGRAGHAVRVCSTTGRSLAGRSRHVVADSVAPDPLVRPGPFATTVQDLVEKHGIDVLFPMTDASIEALLAAGGVGPDTLLPLPSRENYHRASDKAELLEVARNVGIDTPGSLRIEEPGELAQASLSQLEAPYVLKPSRSVAQANGRRVETAVRYAADRAELERLAAEIPLAAYPILVQEYIRGTGEGVFLLRWNQETLATFAHRRIREKPPSGGVSVYREAVAPDPSLVRASERLLDAFDWRGVAMVEYKRSDADGRPYLMEVNGRFWGSLQLAVDAGVDFPALLASAALGDVPDPVTEYRTGIRSRWWWGDVDNLLARLRPQEASNGRTGRSARLRALGEFLVLYRPGDRSEVFRCSDPVPFIEETRKWLAGALGASR